MDIDYVRREFINLLTERIKQQKQYSEQGVGDIHYCIGLPEEALEELHADSEVERIAKDAELGKPSKEDFDIYPCSRCWS